jgi:hypothetical protein
MSERATRTPREHADRRISQLMQARSTLDPVWYEIATLAQPARSRFLSSNGRGNGRANQRAKAHRLYDGHAIQAFRILSGGMTSGLSSPSRPWFKLGVPDDDMMKFEPVQAWLGDVERIIYAFLSHTNFYTAAKTGYAELGLFGTEAMFMEEHWQKGMVFSTLTAGEYYIATGATGYVDTLARHCPMTVHQVVEKFVADRFDKRQMHWDRVSQVVRNAWDASRDDTPVDVMQIVEPNPDWDPGRFDSAGKRFRSMYWEMGRDMKTGPLSLGGYEEQPFVAARWETTGNDVYGSGPGWDALPDMRALQVQAKRLGEATDMLVKPPTIGPAGVKVKMIPGAHTTAASVDMAQVKPLYEIDPRVIEFVKGDMERLYGKIDAAAYADVFMAITQMDGVQPRTVEEIFARNEEKMTQLGPVVERVSTEMLQPVLDRVFYSLMRRGALPPAPEELHGVQLSVEFISVLAQAQRMVGLSQIERVVGFVGNLAAAYPSAADNVDPDELVREYANRAGAPPKILRGEDEVDALRQQRTAQQQQQQAAELMPAVKDGADAAELLSRAPVNQGQSSLLDALMNAGAQQAA